MNDATLTAEAREYIRKVYEIDGCDAEKTAKSLTKIVRCGIRDARKMVAESVDG